MVFVQFLLTVAAVEVDSDNQLPFLSLRNVLRRRMLALLYHTYVHLTMNVDLGNPLRRSLSGLKTGFHHFKN